MSCRTWTLGLVLLLLGVGRPAVAADEPVEKPSKWEFEALPYAWIPGAFGTVEVKGRTFITDVTVKDLLDLTTSGNAFAAGGYFSARWDRWSAFVDTFGGYLEPSGKEKIPTRFCTLCVAGKAKLQPVLLDFAVGYRLGQWSIPKCVRPVSLGVYAGMRYVHLGARLTGSVGVVGGFQRSPNVEDSFNFADPLIGVSFEVPVHHRITVDFRSDIGGFGASAQLIWGIMGGMRYWLPWTPYSLHPWLVAGYKAVAFNRDFGQEGNVNMDLRGPYGGLGITF